MCTLDTACEFLSSLGVKKVRNKAAHRVRVIAADGAAIPDLNIRPLRFIFEFSPVFAFLILSLSLISEVRQTEEREC